MLKAASSLNVAIPATQPCVFFLLLLEVKVCGDCHFQHLISFHQTDCNSPSLFHVLSVSAVLYKLNLLQIWFGVTILVYWLCASVLLLGHYVVAEGVIGIHLILIYTPYRKRQFWCSCSYWFMQALWQGFIILLYDFVYRLLAWFYWFRSMYDLLWKLLPFSWVQASTLLDSYIGRAKM
jgi:hypothetical protein